MEETDIRSLRKTIIKIVIFFAFMTSIMILLRIMRIDNLALGLFLIVVTILGLLIGAAIILTKILSPEGSKDEQESLKLKRATMTEEEKRREFFEIYGEVIFPWKTEVTIFLSSLF